MCGRQLNRETLATYSKMDLDHDRANAKRRELIEQFDEAIHRIAPEVSPFGSDAISHFIQITPPEKESPTFHLVTMFEQGRGGGSSCKPGNITLNIRRLITTVASGVLTIAGIVTAPWTVPFAGIILWDSLWSGIHRDISERDAAILWTMWQHHDAAETVPKAGLVDKVNQQLANAGRNAISQEELDDSLRTLVEIRCIAESRKDSSRWWLREWINVRYQ